MPMIDKSVTEDDGCQISATAGCLVPVILSGGSGSRLWPLSRERHPKQLLALHGDGTLLQNTVARLAGLPGISAPVIICNREHRFVIADQLRQSGVGGAEIVLEPVGRNTAPAVAIAARLALRRDPEAVLLVLPADHVITEAAAFRQALAAARPAAAAGKLLTFGIRPESPETGYGYIEVGEPLADCPGVHLSAAFVEKPPRDLAETYVAGGRHCWNSGMFLFRAEAFLAELQRLAPELLHCVDAALAAAMRDLDFLRLPEKEFAACPSISIDYAVMEKTDRAAVVPCSIGWTDVGSWSALWEIGSGDSNGNVQTGDTLLLDSRDCYVRADHGMVATVGVRDLVVVATQDAVLVADRGRVQDVKRIVETLKSQGRTEHLEHPTIWRPWGKHQLFHEGPGFRIKRLTLNPGGRLSLQVHQHRAEHWVVVSGTALVITGDSRRTLQPDESVFIPAGTVHRLENPGPEELHIVEVQTGHYFGEDDIVRLDDAYGRN